MRSIPRDTELTRICPSSSGANRDFDNHNSPRLGVILGIRGYRIKS